MKIKNEPEIAWISFLQEIKIVMTSGEEMFEEEIKEGKIDNFYLPCYEEYFSTEKVIALTNSNLSKEQKQDLLTLVNDYKKNQHILLEGAKKHLRFLEEERSNTDFEYRENQKKILDIITYETNKKSGIGKQTTSGGKK